MLVRAITAAAALALLPLAAAAETDAEFYKGKTLKMVVGASVTGGYNAHGRVVSRHLGKYIPANPTIIVQNMPAGAGIAATNHVFNVAEKDGTEFGLFNRYTLLSPLLGTTQAKFRSEEFNWLGTTAGYTNNAYLFVIRSSLPYKTVDELRKADPPIHVGNVGSAPIKIMQEALGLRLNVIGGYRGDALDIAFERGEVDGHTIGYLTMMSTKPHWMEKNYARPMIQLGRTDRLPALKDVPTAQELARSEDDRALLRFVEAPLQIGYPFALPPKVPASRVAIMRNAFKSAMEDAELKAEMTKSSLELSPRTGEEIQALVSGLSKATPDVVRRYKDATGEAPQSAK